MAKDRLALRSLLRDGRDDALHGDAFVGTVAAFLAVQRGIPMAPPLWCRATTSQSAASNTGLPELPPRVGVR